MELKNYQKQALAVLRRYLAEARLTGPQEAYRTITEEPEQQERLKGFRLAYRALDELEGTPYVCLRLPTGGGKTILAAHSVSIAKEAWVEKDFPLVLWLVPTTTIRKQTVEALKNSLHPYRQVLDETFAGRVRVFDIGDFDQITPHDLAANCCIVVATIQTLRVSNTEGRRVYAHNEALEPHFSSLPRRMTGLETIDEGKANAGTIRFSFANLLHLNRPLMIVDEAHTAVTGLSRDMQRRVNPSAIIEYTATPASGSNLLHSVTAQALKDEQMIKLPVVLAEHETWQQAVDGALARRAELAAVAETDRDYIRPLVLFQAQNRDQDATVEVLKTYLLEQGIDESRIRIATGDQRELDDVNLFDPDCGVDFIITVEALKEGWDCSFAYIFCSLANVQSATAVEQLLGRVLRMPYAKRRKDSRLNRAYAHLASKNFSETAMALKDRMVKMGFDEDEAIESIVPEQGVIDTALFRPQTRPRPSFATQVSLDATQARVVSAVAPEKLAVVIQPDGKRTIRVTGFLTPAEKERLAEALPKTEADKLSEKLAAHEAEHSQRISPAERGASFVVPRLTARVQGELELADTDLLMEHVDWSLTDHSAQLDKSQFGLQQTANTFSIDVDGRHLSVRQQDESQQLSLDVTVEGWTEQGLVLFLAKQLRQPDISPKELIEWLSRAVSHLTGPRQLPLSALMQCKYVLARRLKDRLDVIKRDVRKNVYQTCLFGAEAKPEISYERGFVFKDGIFTSARKYGGSYTFRSHFTGSDNVPAFDGKPGGEEEMCARQLDGMPDNLVKHWVRNVSQHPDAFYLPLAGSKFYPDFVAELADGKLFVVEYKGDAYATNDDTKEKVAIGQVWERAMAGKGLFLLVEKSVEGRSPRDQMLRKITTSAKGISS